MKRVLFVVPALVALMALTTPAVSAASLSSAQKLRLQLDPSQSGCSASGSSAGWVSGVDSPLDNNSQFLSIHVGSGGCVIAYSNRSFNRVIETDDQKNLSYEFNTSSVTGAGEFYLAAELGNGDIAFLDPYYCQHAIASTPSWSRSDFTGFKQDCAFAVSGSSSTGGYADQACTVPATPGLTPQFFCADGTHSAWKNYVAANPGETVTVVHRYMVFSAGDYQLDRISLGVGVMYTHSNTAGKKCTDEASC
jgi:hypothetical protein